MPTTRKEILAPGMYWASDPNSGKREPFSVTPADIRHFYDTGQEMLGAGLQIPVPLEHQDQTLMTLEECKAAQVANNARWVTRFEIDPATSSLYADLDIPDEELFRKLPQTVKFVSPRIDKRIVDGKGREWGNGKGPISHIALTCKPVWAEQRPFEPAGT